MKFSQLSQLSPLGQLSLIAAEIFNWQKRNNRPNRLD